MRHQTLRERIHSLPVVTLMIIAINVVVYCFTSGSREALDTAVIDFGLIPSKFLAGNVLNSMGRMFTSTVVHAGPVHLAVNMALLWIFGKDVERATGRLEFLMLYLGSCIAAGLLYVAIVIAALPPVYYDPGLVGASGAVAGIMGAYAVRFHRKSFPFGEIRLPALLVIAVWLVVQVVLGILGLYESPLAQTVTRIGYWSHLGGFVFGVVVALMTNMALQGEREHLLGEAERHYDDGNLLEAAQNYEALLKYDPDNAFAHAELGRLWAILEEEDQSLPFYATAIELYLSQGKEDAALKAAEEMKQFWPASELPAPTRLRLATYLEEEGETERAISALREIVERDGEAIEAQMSLLKIGQLQLSALRDAQSAVATLQSFLQRYPKSEWRKFAEMELGKAEASAQRAP